jgi:hypothetical protein
MRNARREKVSIASQAIWPRRAKTSEDPKVGRTPGTSEPHHKPWTHPSCSHARDKRGPGDKRSTFWTRDGTEMSKFWPTAKRFRQGGQKLRKSMLKRGAGSPTQDPKMPTQIQICTFGAPLEGPGTSLNPTQEAKRRTWLPEQVSGSWPAHGQAAGYWQETWQKCTKIV